MRFTMKRILSLFLILLLLPVAALAQDAAQEETEPFYLADFFEGTALDMGLYEGKAVFLNFFTEWCFYCMKEMPDIKKAYDLYDPDSLEIILIHPWDGENADNTASVVAKYGLEGITTVEDEDFAISTLVDVPGYPTSIFIDQDGYLYYAIASMLDYDSLTQILDGMGIPKRETAADAGIISAPEPDDNEFDETTEATPKE